MISIYNIRNGSIITTVSLSAKAASTQITASQNISTKKNVTLSSISLSFAKNKIYAGGSTTATVTAIYSDGSTKDVTSQSSLSGPSYISISGTSVSSQKAIGCLGQKSITATYDGKTNSANLSVISDFKLISLECELYCFDNYRSASGNGNSISLGVPMNDGGEVRTSISGTITTYNNDSYNIIGNSLIKVVFENDNISSTGVSTDWMMPGDNLTMRISYLGEEVKSFGVSFN